MKLNSSYCWLLMLLLFATPSALTANDASLNSGRFGPEPLNIDLGRESSLRLLREELFFEFGKHETSVTARFVLRNTKPNDQHQHMIGFPDEGLANPDNPVFEPLENFETSLNGVPVSSNIQRGYVRRSNNKTGWVPAAPETGFGMAWHTIEAIFPSDQDTVIERRYQTKNGQSNYGVSYFYYVTHTGGAYSGTIGSLKAEIKLKDGLKVDDLVWKDYSKQEISDAEEAVDQLQISSSIKYSLLNTLTVLANTTSMQPSKAQWDIVDQNTLRLNWTNFEPHLESEKSQIVISRYAD